MASFTLTELTPCAECGMPCRPDEYHPFAACLMFKQCHNSQTVRDNLRAVEYGALRAALAAAEARIVVLHGGNVMLQGECERLNAERDRAVKDAERYRWLRDSAHSNRVPHIYQYPAQVFDNPRYPQIRDVGLDAAIDAAIAAGGEGEGS